MILILIVVFAPLYELKPLTKKKSLGNTCFSLNLLEFLSLFKLPISKFENRKLHIAIDYCSFSKDINKTELENKFMLS